MRMAIETPASTPPYLPTVATQILMCFGLYLSFNLIDPSSHKYHHLATENPPLYYYFISVNGGFRPTLQQSLLLQQMENVVRSFDAQFVLTIGELGQEDPLLQNGTRNFPYLRIPPWYATRASEGNTSGNLSKQIKLPYGRTLEIIVLGIDLSKEDDLDTARKSYFEQLKAILSESESDWRFVVGLNPLEDCQESNDTGAIQLHDIRGMFSTYQVNAYLSGYGCEGYVEKGGVAYMSHPGPTHKGYNYGSSREASDGFFVHRLGLLEIETYHVNLEGKLVRKSVVHYGGHEAMI